MILLVVLDFYSSSNDRVILVAQYSTEVCCNTWMENFDTIMTGQNFSITGNHYQRITLWQTCHIGQFEKVAIELPTYSLNHTFFVDSNYKPWRYLNRFSNCLLGSFVALFSNLPCQWWEGCSVTFQRGLEGLPSISSTMNLKI